MKQQGKDWISHEGKSTLSKYLPKHMVLHERLGQKVAAIAVDLEKRSREGRLAMIEACKEALRNNPDKGMTRKFTFFTFDREYKIEYDIQEENARVYMATKNNPSAKDYILVSVDGRGLSFVANPDPTYELKDEFAKDAATTIETPVLFPEDTELVPIEVKPHRLEFIDGGDVILQPDPRGNIMVHVHPEDSTSVDGEEPLLTGGPIDDQDEEPIPSATL